MPRHVSPLRPFVLAALATLALGCPEDDEEGRGAALAGDWRVHILRAGDGVAEDTLPGWIRTRFTVAEDGRVTVHEVLDAKGGTALPAVLPRYAVGADRAVTMVEGPLTGYLGQLSADGRFWVGTGSDLGTSHLRVSQREVPGASYAQADLTGSWHYHVLTTGALVRFEHGRATVQADGATTLSQRFASTDGALEDVDVGRLLVGAGGVVTTEGGADPTWEGVLSADKDLLVVTHTAPSSGPEYELIVVTRLADGVTTADLAGAWKVFMLDQDATGGGWSRVTATFDGAGNGTLSDWEDSSGGSLEGGAAVTVAAAADGTLTDPGNARWHGALVAGGDAWVAVTDRDEGTQASVYLGVRR